MAVSAATSVLRSRPIDAAIRSACTATAARCRSAANPATTARRTAASNAAGDSARSRRSPAGPEGCQPAHPEATIAYARPPDDRPRTTGNPPTLMHSAATSCRAPPIHRQSPDSGDRRSSCTCSSVASGTSEPATHVA
ncbi:hypothetical protein AB0L34_25710 [Micromonospora sp. NPDC052213]|uniref:hypothetical protein n=1 Tax=Micromonospora sp. NPDC052213 TaxID=3155812 RepID=UPI003416BB1A